MGSRRRACCRARPICLQVSRRAVASERLASERSPSNPPNLTLHPPASGTIVGAVYIDRHVSPASCAGSVAAPWAVQDAKVWCSA